MRTKEINLGPVKTKLFDQYLVLGISKEWKANELRREQHAYDMGVISPESDF